MNNSEYLSGKTLLVVDDEPDIITTLKELLSMCDVKVATSYEEAQEILKTTSLDAAILDIMGVRGFDLLQIAQERNITTVMLTAHGLSPENIVRSFENGAASYIAKDELDNIAFLLEEILEDKEKGRDPWERWLNRWFSFYEKRFGPDWQSQHKEFWERFPNWI